MIINCELFVQLKYFSCLIGGAVSETIEIKQDGVLVETVTTNSSGVTNSSIELLEGEYTLIGGISGHEQKIVVNKHGRYNCYPDGAVYWYGNEIYAMATQKGGKTGSYSTSSEATKNTNSIYMYVKTRGNAGSTYYASAYTTGAVDTSKYSYIKVKCTTGAAAYTNNKSVGYKSSAGYGRFSTTASTGTITITSPKTSTYLGANADATTYGAVYSKSGLTLHAIWME